MNTFVKYPAIYKILAIICLNTLKPMSYLQKSLSVLSLNF